MSALVRAYLIPAAVFQSVIIGGGYGTGREVVEYVSRLGLYSGLFSCCVIAVLFGLVLAISFAYAQKFHCYDYRRFLKHLLGRCWFVYEMLFVALLIVVVAVVMSAAADTAFGGFGIPKPITTAAVLVAVIVLSFFGRDLVQQIMLGWTSLLMLCIAVFIATGLARSWSGFFEFGVEQGAGAALLSGSKFAIYNSALVPVLLYSVRGVNSQRTALAAGLLAGIFGALPALLIHLIFSPQLERIIDMSVPTLGALKLLDFGAAVPVFYVVLFGTVVLTAVGVLQGLAERIDGWRVEGGLAVMGPINRAAICSMVVLASVALAQFGIVALVAKGYGALSWGFFLVFTVPLLTLGISRVARR